MNVLYISLLFLTGCSINEYSIMSDDNECVELLLQQNDYCSTEKIHLTRECYSNIVKECRRK